MDKMKMETANKTLENLAKLKELFPEVITESKDENGEIVAAVDAKKLEQLLSTKVIDGDESYDFTWVGKKQAIVEACKPVRKTLRPCKEESVDWENTQNLYIEGDNLDVLKLLQESYLNKVKMIYIDPPYNTGNDSFIYPDDYSENKDKYDEEVGAIDESGYRMFKNTKTKGRFHSSWCSMIYPRLKLARNLLSDDGVIFISIDDHEVANLKKICDEVLGEKNFIAIINWKGRGGRQDSKYYAAVHEYILCYAKNSNSYIAGEEIKTGDIYPKYDDLKKQYYKIQLLRKWGSNSRRADRPNLFYPITAPDGTPVYPMIYIKDKQRPSIIQTIEGCWRHGTSTMKNNLDTGKVEFLKDEFGHWIAYEKIFAPEEGDEKTNDKTRLEEMKKQKNMRPGLMKQMMVQIS